MADLSINDSAFSSARAGILRNAIGVGLATGAYGISFGAVAVASGLTTLQTQFLSIFMFTGASQFATVGILGVGGGAVVAIATAMLLGLRNSVYAATMNPRLQVTGWRRLLAAHLTIDESTAMGIGAEEHGPRAGRLGFWATGAAVFIFWNIGTAIGALGASALGDPAKLGLDAAIPAGFLALLWPRLRNREAWAMALGAGLIALLVTPLIPSGLPILVGAGVVVAIAMAVNKS